MLRLSRRLCSVFTPVAPLPPDKILHFVQVFERDGHPRKVNLTVGAYRDERGKPWVLPCVREALDEVRGAFNSEYLPIPGDPAFIDSSLRLAYGEEAGGLAGVFAREQVAAVQSVSGTGALFLAMTFLAAHHPAKAVYLPVPAWPIYPSLLARIGLEVRPLQYYEQERRLWSFPAFADRVERIPDGSIIVLQVSGYNPTGTDPTPAEWEVLAQLCQRKRLTAVLDMAYQGFVSGDPALDALPVRLFARARIPFLLCQSYAKNFGLYGQRTGCLSIPMAGAGDARRVTDFLAHHIRNVYSSNPRLGSDIVRTVLASPGLTAQWHRDLKTMSSRLQRMRGELVRELNALGPADDWSYVLAQKGMFSYTHLTLPQILKLRAEKGVHLIDSGRISLCGLNDGNVKYVAQMFHEATQPAKAP